MTLKLFVRLPGPLKRAYVHRHGTLLALRWERAHKLAVLYALPSRFLAELVYRIDTRKFQYRRAFEVGRQNDCLSAYAQLVQLPDWVPAVR